MKQVCVPRLRGRRVLPFLALLAAWPALAPAQSTTALSGVVTDSSASAIPGALLTLTNTATGAVRSGESDARGFYQFLQVPPGKYDLAAEMDGFRTALVSGVELLVNTPATVNLEMEIGMVSEVVTVEADAVALNTTDATIGNAFNETKVRQLPLLTRNVVELMSLQTGVNQTGEVLGARKDQNNVVLDGVDVNDQQSPTAFGSVLPVPLDSVQEFRVTVGGGNADVGRSSGGQVSLVTKSGTNELHGSLYEFHRNTATAANTFFNNRAGVDREKLIRNQYGGSIGGPIVKNRAFYFLNYEGRRDAREASQLRTVPSETLKQGILRVETTDRSRYALTPAEFATADPAGLGVNPAMLQLLARYPQGNDPGSSADGGLNFEGFRFNAPVQLDHKAYVAKFDFNIDQTGSHRVSWRGTLADNVADRESNLAQFPGEEASKILDNSRGFSAQYTGVLKPTLINDLRVGYTRLGTAISGVDGSFLSLAGITNIQNGARGTTRISPTWNIADDVNWVRGNHNVKFGGNVRFIVNNRQNYTNVFPSYTMGNGSLAGLGSDIQGGINSVLQQRLGNPNVQLAANQLAQMSNAALNLTGVVTGFAVTYQYDAQGNLLPIGSPADRSFGTQEYEFYVSDSWRATNNLTITYGLRYSYFRPPYERNGLQGATTVPLESWMAERVGAMELGIPANVLPSSSLTWIASGPANGADSWFNHDRNNFAPRLSIAWNPKNADGPVRWIFGSNGVLRLGGGLFFDRFGSFLVTQADQLGTFGVQNRVANPQAYNFTTGFRYNGAFPELPPAPPGGFPFTPPLNRAIAGSGLGTATNLTTPYSMPITATISREIPGGMTFEAGYVGRFGRNLLGQHDPASPLIFFKDPASGQTLADAFQANRTLFEDQGITNAQVAANPGLIPNQPFFENMFPGLANYAIPGSASANFFYVNNLWGRESELDTLDQLDRQPSPFSGTGFYKGANSAPNCIVVTGCYTFFANQFPSLPVWENLGSSNFHGLTLSLRKRFTRDFTFDFNYTWSHSIDIGSAAEGNLNNPFQPTDESGGSNTAGNIINTFRREQNRGSSDFDIRQQFNLNGIWDLPFGRGKRFGADAPGWLNQFIGGWQLSGITRYRTGLPVGIANGGRWSTNFFGSGRALIVGEVDAQTTVASNGVPGIFADPRAAAEQMRFNRTGMVGPRNVFRVDDFFNTDMSLGKRFTMPWEGHSVQFRAEAFNVFNQTNFSGRSMRLTYTSPATLGNYTQTEAPRVLQFGLRYEF